MRNNYVVEMDGEHTFELDCIGITSREFGMKAVVTYALAFSWDHDAGEPYWEKMEAQNVTLIVGGYELAPEDVPDLHGALAAFIERETERLHWGDLGITQADIVECFNDLAEDDLARREYDRERM